VNAVSETDIKWKVEKVRLVIHPEIPLNLDFRREKDVFGIKAVKLDLKFPYR
jgi:hypothetical protein